MNIFHRLVLAAALCAGTVASAQTAKVSRPGEYSGYSPQLYTEVQRSSMYFRTRDGTRLAMDIHRPAINGKPVDTPYPVVWQHTAARRVAPDQALSVVRQMPALAQYGYVVVEVDRRGMGASFGTRRAYHSRIEARDAYDITEWLALQAWSSGKVGVYGCSNTGDAALHAITLQPPHLKAAVAGCFSWSKYDGFMRGGILANWGSGIERPVDEDLKNPPVDGDEDRTLLRQAVDEHRANSPLAAMWRAMPFRDSWSDLVGSRFWIEGSAVTYRDQIARSGVPLYIIGGWFDDFRREGLVAYTGLANNPRKIVIGPWEHCRNPGFDLLADVHRFFDHWLKGIDNGVMREPPVRYYTQGAPAANVWRDSQQWPPAGSVTTTYHLQMAASPREHLLADKMPTSSGKAELPVLPPIACGEKWSPMAQTCLQDANGLRFTSQALPTDRELTGHPLMQLWVTTTRPDQNVFAYLEDVAPDGQVNILTDGRLKASLRATHKPPYDNLGLPWQRSLEEDELPAAIGQPVPLRFDMLPLSYIVKAGHRLRVTVTGSDTRERPAAPPGHLLTLLSDAQHPSFVSLPVMPARQP